MHLRVKITNPSENDLRGDLTVNARTNYVLHGELSEIHFDLAPGESKVAEISILGGRFIADSGLDHELLRLMLKLKFSILNMTRWPHIVKLKR